MVGMAHQLRHQHCHCRRLVDLPLANEMKSLGVTLGRHLTFEKHISTVVRSCNYHNQDIRHIRHLLTTQLAQMLACSLILSRLDYYNAVLHGIPSSNIQKLQRVQNSAERIKAISHQAITTYSSSCTGCRFNIKSRTSWRY